MSWEDILWSPGLSHLATEVFLMLDLETFARLELICKSWRSHIINNGLWKKRLFALAKDGACNRKLVDKVVA